MQTLTPAARTHFTFWITKFMVQSLKFRVVVCPVCAETKRLSRVDLSNIRVQSPKFKGLFPPMKELLRNVTRLNDQELLQWWTCALCICNVLASEGTPVWIIIHFETL